MGMVDSKLERLLEETTAEIWGDYRRMLNNLTMSPYRIRCFLSDGLTIALTCKPRSIEKVD